MYECFDMTGIRSIGPRAEVNQHGGSSVARSDKTRNLGAWIRFRKQGSETERASFPAEVLNFQSEVSSMLMGSTGSLFW